jgi:hypothetical protein
MRKKEEEMSRAIISPPSPLDVAHELGLAAPTTTLGRAAATSSQFSPDVYLV